MDTLHLSAPAYVFDVTPASHVGLFLALTVAMAVHKH